MSTTNDRAPIYATIYSDLRQQIFSGMLAPGDMLPSENILCSEYNASRETVRRGLKELMKEGLIYSRPKVGYFVSTPNHSDFTLCFSEEWDNCTDQYKDIHAIIPNERIRSALGLQEGKIAIEFTMITYDGDHRPVAYSLKYVPYERAYPSVESELRYAVFPDAALSKLAPYSFHTNIDVQAVNATPELAQILQCPVGEALLMIERIYIHQDGKRMGYALRYARQPYGKLHGEAGPML